MIPINCHGQMNAENFFNNYRSEYFDKPVPKNRRKMFNSAIDNVWSFNLNIFFDFFFSFKFEVPFELYGVPIN